MALSFNYDMSARDVMHHPEIGKRFALMKKAGVEHVWLFAYFYGRHESDPDEIYKARKRLMDEGFQTGVISVPVGHPGNSLNPDDDTLELQIKNTWKYRVDRNGNNEYFSACINEEMIRDNRSAAKEYAQMGFTRHFFDDDLRLGNWQGPVQGCFCDKCIEKFNQKYNVNCDRALLKRAADEENGLEDLTKMWIQYNTSKITGFMQETRVSEMQSGVMVMHMGDERHGISISDIKKAVPDCLFRVGEMFFNDETYSKPEYREMLKAGVKKHLSLIGENTAYSETTVFPAASMSIENFLHRMNTEIELGLRNIFLMSGTWFYSEPYWNAIIENRNALEEKAARLDALKG
ncbi:MAG: hypothetical protein IJN21_03820 [Clostridia bacterium]|nr:hypothetical protein [Clostridiales bacterium]MBQ6715632.1 hypothetical protein [Clostridia bacterium]